MNVLFVTGIFPPDHGGPASYVPRMATVLVQRGHTIEVICLADRTDHDDASTYRFRVRRIRRGIFWPLRVLRTVLTIWRSALRHDLVYVNGLGTEATLAALLAGRRCVHKIVGDYAWERARGRGWFTGTIDEYQTAPKGLALRVLDAVRAWPQRCAHEVIVPSRYLARLAAGWGIAPEKIRVIYNAVALSRATATEATTLPAWRGRTLMTVCRLVPWKGVDALIRLLGDLPETRLVVAGDGYLRDALGALARECGVAERVLFLGDVPHASVGSYLAQADAFVLNSTYEGLPHVVLEAMAVGVPVIATDAGGTGEVVTDDQTGLLVPVGDTAALRAAVERLWRDPELCARLVAGALTQLGGVFALETMLTSTETALREAIPPARARAAEERLALFKESR